MDIPDDFIIEAVDLLDEAEANLIHLTEGPDFLSKYNTIFRAFHSLKGAAGMFGLDDLQKHMHYFEDLLEKSKHQQHLSAKKIDYFLSAIDCARHCLRGEALSFKYVDPDVHTEEKIEYARSSTAVEKKSEKALVYVVDDEIEIGDYIKFLLAEANYRCITFSNPNELISKFDEDGEKPDAIVSDFKMPHMTGHELMLKVHEKNPLLPFVLISGFINKSVALEAIANGVTAIIEKPIDEKMLLSSIGNAVVKYQAVKLLNRSIDIILYQYADLESFLIQNKKDSVRDMLKEELKTILDQRKLLFKKGVA